MTREEEIIEASRYWTWEIETALNDLHKDYPSIKDIPDAFIHGALWADKNPKIDWISVKDDLPCNYKDLMKNENYTKRVLVILSWNEDPTHIHIDISDMSNVIGSHNVGFYWRSNSYYTVTHWRELPELPKE